jgi:hypothetical protein
MNTILIAVTVVALAMAATMAVIVIAVLRQERARSEARVAALSAMAAEVADEPRPLSHEEPLRQEIIRPEPARREIVAAPAVTDPVPVHRFSEQPLEDDGVDDFEIRPGVTAVSNLFSEPERTSPWGPRFVVIGCLAAIVLAIGLALGLTRSHSSPAGTSTSAPATARNVSPLELLSLRYAQESDRLVITGLVQNPRGATPVSHVVATAFVFGPDGSFLSSGRAPLDFVTLTPGEESPFVVNVPVTGQVTRYRIGFRTEDGRVLPHVDKRAPDSLAQK